jgi:putative ABC transport system ATP-binding protein
MIQTIELKKTFAAENVETHAIQDISLTIEEGEFVAVMGPSGCGKSTLLHLLGLLDKPTSGQLSLMGYEVSSYSERERVEMRRGNIGFVFQSFNLIDDLTVYENVELPLQYLQTPTNQRKKMVHETLERMNLNHRRSNYPQQLSGGQQQLTAFARAIIINPRLILADEPTGNLDSVNGHKIMRMLDDLHDNGKTIVMVTHSTEYAEQADRIIQLFDGHIVG